MGWKSDWLYKLIFKEIEAVWLAALREHKTALNRNQHPGKLLERLIVQECENANWNFPGCLDPVIRQWIYDGIGFSLASTDEISAPESHVDQGMFHTTGRIRFHIDSPRKRIVLTYVLGPLHGRGKILQVRGQGKRARLEAAGGPAWVS